ncbi:MAG: hypothetical protein V7K64_22705 [Nostoc sp.]|uniref:hypothetical protein n=1 Tax=Nostoc sp. TaxID=1180 RepID=UPI002FF86191
MRTKESALESIFRYFTLQKLSPGSSLPLLINNPQSDGKKPISSLNTCGKLLKSLWKPCGISEKNCSQ